MSIFKNIFNLFEIWLVIYKNSATGFGLCDSIFNLMIEPFSNDLKITEGKVMPLVMPNYKWLGIFVFLISDKNVKLKAYMI